MNSVRNELLGVTVQSGIPDLLTTLPPRWPAYDASGVSERAMLAQASERFRPMLRGDHQGLHEPHVSSASRVARERQEVIPILPSDDKGAGLFAPEALARLDETGQQRRSA